MNKQMRLSVVIATRDEEKNIGKCMESVKWADEIVIVDDVSADRTVEICKGYTNKIFINDSKEDFHKNKNLGIEKASKDWILSIDADERITEKLSEEIKNAIQDKERIGYYISRKNYFLGKWIRGCGWYPDYIIRLFRKGVTEWPLEIHDVPSIKDKSKVGYLNNSLIHMSYTSIEQYIKKFAQYTTKLAKEEHEKGTRITKVNFLFLFLIKPLYWFCRKYFLMHGYAQGFRGFFISVASASTIFMSYAKLWEILQKD